MTIYSSLRLNDAFETHNTDENCWCRKPHRASLRKHALAVLRLPCQFLHFKIEAQYIYPWLT